MTTVTVDRAVLEQALAAMDKATRFMSDSDYVRLNQAIDALRAALAQQEQEPTVRIKCTVVDNQHPSGVPFEQWVNAPRRELDTMWFQAQHDAIKANEDFTRYRFAALIAAAEREACAKVCEDTTAAWTQPVYNGACMDCAAAIRARGNK